MIYLVRNLLDVARIEEGRYLYNPTLGDISQVIGRVVDNHKRLIREKKLRVEIKKPEKILPKIIIDRDKMEIALNNILENSINYTPAGGKIDISLKQNKGDILISIADTGIGIPKEQQDRVFSKFFRGTNAVKVDTKGAGLGLYITKNIIEAHGGKIWFKSKEGKGTVFYIRLPVRKKRNSNLQLTRYSE